MTVIFSRLDEIFIKSLLIFLFWLEYFPQQTCKYHQKTGICDFQYLPKYCLHIETNLLPIFKISDDDDDDVDDVLHCCTIFLCCLDVEMIITEIQIQMT